MKQHEEAAGGVIGHPQGTKGLGLWDPRGGKTQSLPLEFDALVRKPVGLPVGVWRRGRSTPTHMHARTGNNR